MLMEADETERSSRVELEAETLRRDNPGFARLVDVISGVYHEDGVPKSLKLQLKQVILHSITAKKL